VAPENLEMVADSYRRRLDGEDVPREYEYRVLHKDGKTPVYVTMHAGLKESHGTKATVGTVKDITERKRVEKALQQSEEMYRTLFENTGTAMLVLEDDMLISHVNDEMEHVWGYSKGEIEGKVKWTELVVQDDLERMMAYHRLRRSDPEAAPRSYEFHFIHKNGEVRDAALTAAMIPGTKKSVISIRDITDRKRMEEELRRSEALYRTVFEATSAPTVIVEEDTTVVLVNEEFAKLAGYTKEELEGTKSWTEFVAKEDLERMKKYHYARRAEAGSAPRNYDFRFTDRYGDVRDIYLTISMIPGTTKSVASFLDITAMKKTEEEILARDREQQVILDSVPISIFHIDSDGTFVHVNEVLAKRYGRKPEDFKGKSSRDLFPKVAEEYIKSDKEVIESGEPQIGAIRKIKTPQGVRWVRLDKVPLKDAEGNVTGIIGFELDITRLKRIEEKLQEREREYQTVLDTVPVGIYHIDADSRFIHVNEALAERYGMTPEDFKGKTSRELFPDVGEEYLESDKEVLESGVPQRGVTSKLTTPEGVKWVRLDKVPLKDADGNITDIVGFELDITERIETQEELRNAHKKMQDIVEFLPDATFVIDRDMKVIAWNRAIEEMTGIPKDDIIGKGDYEYALPFYGERRPILTDLVFSSDEEIKSRYTHVEKKGNTLFAEVYSPFMYGGKGAHLWGIATPLYDPEGNVVGAIESIRDITERKQAEKERDDLFKELEAKNREMGHFTYTVSHDLRSPLVTIQGFTTMLQKDIEQNERERAENDLKYIESAVTKMSALLSDTLELSRIGSIVNPPEDVPFGDIVQDALEQTAGDLNAHVIDVSVANDFPTVHVDRMRIVEVLVNFITNSIKYRGDQPQPKIEIGYRVAGNETVFFVKDNGIGIDKSQYEKVFELFYQVDKGGEGTGAGLAIVKRIVEVHGGRIWIESEKGKGCTVCFTLPVR